MSPIGDAIGRPRQTSEVKMVRACAVAQEMTEDSKTHQLMTNDSETHQSATITTDLSLFETRVGRKFSASSLSFTFTRNSLYVCVCTQFSTLLMKPGLGKTSTLCLHDSLRCIATFLHLFTAEQLQGYSASPNSFILLYSGIVEILYSLLTVLHFFIPE
jgi:hypothetical protein